MSYHGFAMLVRACGVWSRLSPPEGEGIEADGAPRRRDSFLHRIAPMRSASATGLAASALLLVALSGGCFVDYDFDNTSFTCSDGTCPSGYQCVAERCVQPSAAGDAGGGGGADAAAAADAAAGGADAAVELATCDEQFGASTGYQLCIEAETSCEFFHLAEVAEACADVCALYGATCLTTFNSDEATPCTRQEEAVCTTTRSSQICICSRGAGEDGAGG